MAFAAPHTGVSDDMLLGRLKAHDLAALDALYRREAGPVYRYALALCANPAWAADATQDAFVQLAQRPHGFDAARGTLGAYLAGMARHALLRQWKEPVREYPAVDEAEEQAGASHWAASPEGVLVAAQTRDAVWEAIRALPWMFREALVLVDLQERSYAEAALIAGVELNTLRTRLYRARQQLARRLGAEQGVLP
jgi:RNA polymerase sigma-70 factor (ECF subfamily)